jgi:hypothetical protein
VYLISTDEEIKLSLVWNLRSNHNIQNIYTNGNYLIVITNESLKVYEFKEGKDPTPFNCAIPNITKQMHIVMSNRHIYTYSDDNKIRQYELKGLPPK